MDGSHSGLTALQIIEEQAGMIRRQASIIAELFGLLSQHTAVEEIERLARLHNNPSEGGHPYDPI